MSKTEPTIQKFMTPMPHFIGPEALLPQARKIMDDFNIRHLPIVEEGMKVVGMISDRDLKMAMGTFEASPKEIKVKDIAIHNPYIVDPATSLRQVVDMMLEKKIGSAIVAQNQKLMGIFTRADACRALSQILRTFFVGAADKTPV